jgi:proteasome accessory factor C
VSATDDVARMLTLVPWLLERPGASLRETADAFGVSEDRIRRDLEQHLDFCGLPGLGGGDLFEVSIEADRILVRMADELRRPLRLTPAEGLRLVLSVDAVAEVLRDELPALPSAVARVREALGLPERVADVLEPTSDELALTARQAIADGRRIELSYQGRGDDAPRRREVDPFAVRVVGGRWYLQGHDHGAGGLRTFRLDRAASLAVTDTPIEVPPPAELPVPRYQPGADDVTVTLAVTAAARWLADVVDVDHIDEREGGTAEFTFTTDAPRHVARLVLMAGGDATVLSPPELADTVRELAHAAAGRYEVAGD